MRLTPSFLQFLILISGLGAITASYLGFSSYYILKPLTTILILSFPIRYRAAGIDAYTKQIGVGLLFCLLGDSFLLFEDYFVLGLGSFLIGHLFFLIAFIQRQGWRWQPKTALVLLVIATALFLLISRNLATLFYPVLLYLIVIALMSWQGWALAFNPKIKNVKFLGIGVSLFLLSDALIAIDKFYTPFLLSSGLILSTYWLAIFLIAQTASKYSK